MGWMGWHGWDGWDGMTRDGMVWDGIARDGRYIYVLWGMHNRFIWFLPVIYASLIRDRRFEHNLKRKYLKIETNNKMKLSENMIETITNVLLSCMLTPWDIFKQCVCFTSWICLVIFVTDALATAWNKNLWTRKTFKQKLSENMKLQKIWCCLACTHYGE